MKEFIEKLIGRLEEKAHQTWLVLAERNGYERAIEIVNQLAEEYINCSTDTSSGWIPCSEKMPLFIDNVLVCTKSGGRTVACLTNGKRFCDMYMNIIDNVVAWMPLPPAYAPEEGRE